MRVLVCRQVGVVGFEKLKEEGRKDKVEAKKKTKIKLCYPPEWVALEQEPRQDQWPSNHIHPQLLQSWGLLHSGPQYQLELAFNISPDLFAPASQVVLCNIENRPTLVSTKNQNKERGAKIVMHAASRPVPVTARFNPLPIWFQLQLLDKYFYTENITPVKLVSCQEEYKVLSQFSIMILKYLTGKRNKELPGHYQSC